MQTQEIQKILKWGWIVLVILALFLGVHTLSALKSLRNADPAYNSITVTGQGEAFAVPDLATFSFTVSFDAPTVAGAQEKVTGKMDAIISELQEMGIDEKDIKTTDYSVWPKYTYASQPCSINYCPPGQQKQDGYTANHSITVKVRKTEDAGKALTVVGVAGATGLSSISFTVDDPDAITDEARREAIKDAREKAEALAKELGVKLVKVVSFSDSTDGGVMPYPMGMGRDMMVGSTEAKAPTLPTGENKVSVHVSVTYEIR